MRDGGLVEFLCWQEYQDKRDAVAVDALDPGRAAVNYVQEFCDEDGYYEEHYDVVVSRSDGQGVFDVSVDVDFDPTFSASMTRERKEPTP